MNAAPSWGALGARAWRLAIQKARDIRRAYRRLRFWWRSPKKRAAADHWIDVERISRGERCSSHEDQMTQLYKQTLRMMQGAFQPLRPGAGMCSAADADEAERRYLDALKPLPPISTPRKKRIGRQRGE